MQTDNSLANINFNRGYVEGYRRAKSSKIIPKETVEPMHLYASPYIIITYPTAVVVLLAVFIIMILIAMHLDRRPVTYVSAYEGDCLLQLTSSYSGVGCV